MYLDLFGLWCLTPSLTIFQSIWYNINVDNRYNMRCKCTIIWFRYCVTNKMCSFRIKQQLLSHSLKWTDSNIYWRSFCWLCTLVYNIKHRTLLRELFYLRLPFTPKHKYSFLILFYSNYRLSHFCYQMLY